MKKTIILLVLATLTSTAWSQTWTGTWATAPEFAGEQDMPKTSLANTAVRQIVHVSIGGQTLRLKLSNEFSKQPVDIKSVYIANPTDSNRIDPKTARYLSFSGKRNVTIEPGRTVTSDALSYDLRPLQRLTITISYGSEVPQNATCHRGSRTTSFIMAGESKPHKPFQNTEKVEHWYNISSIDVLTTGQQPCIAVLGNSITDGRGTTTDLQNRWTDVLAEQLNGTVGVLNLGIGGNCVLAGGLGQPAVQRFDRDILGQHGVSHLVVFEGINDIGNSKTSEATAGQLIDTYRKFIDTAHQHGIKVILGTITPLGNTFYWSFFHEAARQTVNEWIRTTTDSDGFIDFDKLVSDPEKPTQMRADWQYDWLHPNPAGYENMGTHAATVIKKHLSDIPSRQASPEPDE